jgi:hypothetical protein
VVYAVGELKERLVFCTRAERNQRRQFVECVLACGDFVLTGKSGGSIQGGYSEERSEQCVRLSFFG